MRRSAARGCPPARAATVLSPKILTPLPDSSLPRPRKSQTHRRLRSPAFAGAIARTRRNGNAGGGKRSGGPATPLLRWKFDGDADHPGEAPPECGGKLVRKHRNADGEDAPAISARRLAAGIWHLQQHPEVGGSGGECGGTRLGFEPNPGHLHHPYACDHDNFDLHTDSMIELSRAISLHCPKNGILHKLEASVVLPNSAMEGATKWYPGCSKASDEVYRIYSHLKHLEDQQMTSVTVVSSLKAELQLARARIIELEAERRSERKKLDHYFRKLAEEKASWQSREHEKIRAVMDAMKDDLKRERKNRQRMEIVNSKLVNELAEAKLSAKRFLKDYEKERKARELMEEVCDELAKEITENKAEVEEMMRESDKIREEVEEERKMLQMAEVWREERVQMKLIDAKLMLEDKYSQLSKLQADIDAFLQTRSSSNPNVSDTKEAELLQEATGLVKVQEIKKFSYQPPPASEDIFSIFEELQQREETKEREIEQCYGYSPSPASHASKIQTSSPDINGFLEKPMKKYAIGFINRNGQKEYDSDWETVSHEEAQGSSNSPEGSDPSVNGIYRESNASVSGTDWEETVNNGRLSSEISEGYSSMTKQSRKKASSIIRLWRSSSPNNGENFKKHSAKATNGRMSNGRISNATLSPTRKSGEVAVSSPSVGQWSSPDSLNPRITRRIKECMEQPNGIEKQNLKSKLLEARVESQKVQLRHVLKQKI